MTVDVRCPVCGSACRVVGDTTQHYEPRSREALRRLLVLDNWGINTSTFLLGALDEEEGLDRAEELLLDDARLSGYWGDALERPVLDELGIE